MTGEDEVVLAPCMSISPVFAAGPSIWRRCLGEKQWSQISFTNCTLGASVGSFAIIWMTLNNTSVNENQLLSAVSVYIELKKCFSSIKMEIA